MAHHRRRIQPISRVSLAAVAFLFTLAVGPALAGIVDTPLPAVHWHAALRACEIRPRKFYATRRTFISAALTAGLNVKFIAEYTGTSLAMIEQHYGRSSKRMRARSSTC